MQQHTRTPDRTPEPVHTIVVGAGQAGLSVGYHLSRHGIPFLILDASQRIGDQWRRRWDSLRLFTPARFDSLDGLPFPADPDSFPTKDQMADYLEAYAAHFHLPVRSGVRVDRLSKQQDGRFLITAGHQTYTAENVVVAMARYQKPRVPDFARDLDPTIVQLHSSEYRSPAQLREGPVLLVGAGNSGSEIAMELAKTHPVVMSGRPTGEVPFRIESAAARLLLVRLVLRGLFHRLLTVDTPMGRKMRPQALAQGGPLIRVKSRDLAAAGVERAPRTAGVRNGQPALEDGRLLDVANVIWCTGFHHAFEWIDLPIHGELEPLHHRGISPEPGLFFVGLHFQYALSSAMIHGVGRDAARIAKAIAARAHSLQPTTQPQSALQPA